ncbi:MAG: hypothetical protein JSW55_02625 [Chloroflexota bacterium]|nr:MAG: hypothetical protein JSW55_02625 [Chloroflexota bacterium]
MGYLDPNDDFVLEDGDLLFQDLACRFICEAIERVTPGYHNADITHIGIYRRVGGRDYVIEAVPPEVKLTPLTEFFGRANDHFDRPTVFVGRLKPEYQDLIPAAIERALELKGMPYDRFYLNGEDAYYCSELVVKAFRHANGGYEFFPEQPMSFVDLDTGEVHENWRRYYKHLGMELPVGELGSSPGEISLSPKIEIVHRYGFLTNWHE